MCSQWLNILITSYSKEARNTGTFKHVFLRESKFLKKEYIIHSNVVRNSLQKVQKKRIDIYFFTVPTYHRSVMTESYQNNKVKTCFVLPQNFWKKGRMTGLIKEKNFVIVKIKHWLVSLEFSHFDLHKNGAYFFLVWHPSISVAWRNSARLLSKYSIN